MTTSFYRRCARFALAASLLLNVACGGSGSELTGPTPSPASPAPSPSPSPTPSPSPSPSPSVPGCTAGVSGLPSTVSEASGRYTFALATPSACAWTARTDVSWADITPGSGQGDASLVLAIARNETRDARTVTVTINAQALRVVQNGVACSYSVTPAALDLNADTSNASVVLTTAPGCAWGAASSESWIRPRLASGSGAATIGLDVTANSGEVRTAFLTIAGQRVSVTQQRRPTSTSQIHVDSRRD